MTPTETVSQRHISSSFTKYTYANFRGLLKRRIGFRDLQVRVPAPIVYVLEPSRVAPNKSVRYHVRMKTETATADRAKLYRLIDNTATEREPVLIRGKNHAAVLVAEDDWRAIQETLFLLSIPGMGKSIREGMDTPTEACDEELQWE